VKPFYATEDGSVRVFCSRWEDVRDAGVFKLQDIGLVHADPPYGKKLRFKGRGASRVINGCIQHERTFPPIEGDDRPFDPSPLLALDRPMIAWGGNYYSSRLPDVNSWIMWDKRDGNTPDDGSDGELAWSNLGGPLRIFRHLWKGTLRASECATKHLHPTQKPEALCAFDFAHAMARKKLRRGQTILVTHGGSMPEIRPALAIGCKIVVCEVSLLYCQDAVSARCKAMPDAPPLQSLTTAQRSLFS
jgi:site-specific DNA-methyltransferase (adenine-specific)